MNILKVKNAFSLNKLKEKIQQGGVIMKFFAPWCGHCKDLEPKWTAMTEKLKGQFGGTIAEMDDSMLKNSTFQSMVTGFPTVVGFKKGGISKIFNGNRTIDELVKFAKQFSGQTGGRHIKDGPRYNPKKWNKKAKVRYSHNCYSYMLNKKSNKRARKCKPPKCKHLKIQPGFKKRNRKIKKVTCRNISKRMRRDYPRIKRTRKKTCEKGKYKGALFIHPKRDFHFYRRDKNGWWSHKDGEHRATNKDSKGERIKNPRKASRKNRRKRLHYKKFCGYYCIPKNKTTRRRRQNNTARRRRRKKGNKRR